MIATNGLRIQVHSTFESARRFRPDWDRLSADVPMHGWSWFMNWWDAFEDHSPWERNQLALATVTDAHDRLIGVAPFYVCSQTSLRSLRFLADGKATTDYLRLLAESRYEFEVATAVAEWIRSTEFTDRFGNIDLFVVDGHKQSELSIERLFQLLSAQGWLQQTTAIENAWDAPLFGDWEKKYVALSSNQRRVAKKARRRLEDGLIQIEMIADGFDFDRNWNDFVRLHQLRRKDVGDSGCFDDPSFEQFLYGATRALVDTRQAKLVFASENGVRFGVAFWLLSESKIFGYQNGMDPQYKHLEPGHLLNTFSMLWGLENGISYIDFMRGNEPYKKQWGGVPTQLFRTRLVAPTWSAKVKEVVWQTARKVKQTSREWLKGVKQEAEVLK